MMGRLHYYHNSKTTCKLKLFTGCSIGFRGETVAHSLGVHGRREEKERKSKYMLVLRRPYTQPMGKACSPELEIRKSAPIGIIVKNYSLPQLNQTSKKEERKQDGDGMRGR